VEQTETNIYQPTKIPKPFKVISGWWRGVLGNAFRLKQSYSTLGPVSTVMGETACGQVNHLGAKPAS